MRKTGIVLVALLLVVSIFGVNPESDEVSAKKEVKTSIGKFSIYLNESEHPFLTHSPENGVIVNQLDISDRKSETFLSVIVDEDGNPIECKPTNSSYLRNLILGLKGKIINREINDVLGDDDSVDYLYVGIYYPADDDYKNDDGFLKSYGKKSARFNGFTSHGRGRGCSNIMDYSLVLMDGDFNYMCYVYDFKKNKMVMTEQKALNPDFDYGKYPTLVRDLVIPNEWDWPGNVSKGYLWVKPFSEKFYAGGVEGYLPRIDRLVQGDELDEIVHEQNKNDPVMVDAMWFIHVNYGVETYDSEYREPRKSTLYKMFEGGDREVYTTKVQLEEGNDIAIINDTEEFKLRKTPYGALMVPLDDLCEIFNMKTHYRPFDGSILIERF
ncbi:MAG: hypothetical protein R2883_05295 [Caldisericia bacterium]